MPVWGSHLGTSQTLCTPLRVSTRSRGSCSTEDPEWVIIVPLCQRETPLASGLAARDQQGGCGALTPLQDSLQTGASGHHSAVSLLNTH